MALNLRTCSKILELKTLSLPNKTQHYKSTARRVGGLTGRGSVVEAMKARCVGRIGSAETFGRNFFAAFNSLSQNRAIMSEFLCSRLSVPFTYLFETRSLEALSQIVALDSTKRTMKVILLTLFSLTSVSLISSCQREKVDGRLITSYSIKADTEADRVAIITDFETFLDKSGMQKALAAGAHKEGFHGDGDTTVRWDSLAEPFSITVTKSKFPKLLSGDIAWDFRGSKADWLKLEFKLQDFQKEVVEWFKKRPDVNHVESSFWDGSM